MNEPLAARSEEQGIKMMLKLSQVLLLLLLNSSDFLHTRKINWIKLDLFTLTNKNNEKNLFNIKHKSEKM